MAEMSSHTVISSGDHDQSCPARVDEVWDVDEEQPAPLFLMAIDEPLEDRQRIAPEEGVSGLRELTAEELDDLYSRCLNQLHFAQEELRMRLSPAEL
jgi:hypothetical protein